MLLLINILAILICKESPCVSEHLQTHQRHSVMEKIQAGIYVMRIAPKYNKSLDLVYWGNITEAQVQLWRKKQKGLSC